MIETIIKIQNIVAPVLLRENEYKEKFPIGFTFNHFLERTNYSLTSLKILLSNNIIENDHAIGLIGRNILSDFLTVSYIIAKSLSVEDDKVFYSLYKSDLDKMNSYLTLSEKYNLISPSEIQDIVNIYSDENLIYQKIKSYNKNFKVSPFPSIKNIAEQFMNVYKNHVLAAKVIQSYDIWLLLSKYEHIGIHSYTLTRPINIETLSLRAKFILSFAALTIGCSLSELKEQSAFSDIMKIYEKLLSDQTQ